MPNANLIYLFPFVFLNLFKEDKPRGDRQGVIEEGRGGAVNKQHELFFFFFSLPRIKHRKRTRNSRLTISLRRPTKFYSPIKKIKWRSELKKVINKNEENINGRVNELTWGTYIKRENNFSNFKEGARGGEGGKRWQDDEYKKKKKNQEKNETFRQPSMAGMQMWKKIQMIKLKVPTRNFQAVLLLVAYWNA